MRFLDLFSGIGGFRLGMEQAGHECVGYVEFDKFARKSYQAMYDTKGEWTAHDITTVTNDDIRLLGEERRIDVITAGFPCQAFSIAGKRKGFKDTRGTLFFEIARFAEQIKPRLLLLENVKGLLSHNKGETFATILNTLDELGYDAEWQVLNSKHFGIPQNRERVFIVGHLRDRSRREVFPIQKNGAGNGIEVVGKLNINANEQNKRIYSPNGISPSLTTMQGGGQEPKIVQNRVELIAKESSQRMSRQAMETFNDNDCSFGDTLNAYNRTVDKSQISPTLTTRPEGFKTAILPITEDLRVRKLTPKECWRLQGFPDELFERAAEVNSDSQLYKQAGNSVTVNVIHEIAKKF